MLYWYAKNRSTMPRVAFFPSRFAKKPSKMGDPNAKPKTVLMYAHKLYWYYITNASHLALLTALSCVCVWAWIIFFFCTTLSWWPLWRVRELTCVNFGWLLFCSGVSLFSSVSCIDSILTSAMIVPFKALVAIPQFIIWKLLLSADFIFPFVRTSHINLVLKLPLMKWISLSWHIHRIWSKFLRTNSAWKKKIIRRPPALCWSTNILIMLHFNWISLETWTVVKHRPTWQQRMQNRCKIEV